MKYFKILLKLFKTNGIKRTIFLIYVYLISPFSTKVRQYVTLAFIRCLHPRIPYSLAQIKNIRARSISLNNTPEYTVTIEQLGLPDAMLVRIKRELEAKEEVLIADIDQDGFLCIPEGDGEIKEVPQIDKRHFMPRKRLKIQIVALGDTVAVKKSFGKKIVNLFRFVNEIKVLGKLAGKCNVPDILKIDYENRVIYMSYIPGAVLREELAKRGAIIRDRDVEGNPPFEELNPRDRDLRRIHEGRKYLSECISKDFVDEIFHELKKCHALGVCLNDIKYGNIIIHSVSNKPYLIDFDASYSFRNAHGYYYDVMRDRDIEMFNLHFNEEKLTRRRIVKKIKEFSRTRWYIPVYCGKGMYIGRVWNTEAGDGKWHYILKNNLPPFKGKRILDLGCNNGYISIQLLRNGAGEVIGVERDDLWVARAKFVKEACEWADNQIYNFKIVKARMEYIPSMDIGTFDFVMALCSLYYMEKADMKKIIDYLATITDTVVLQCNVNPADHSGELYQRASVEYNTQLLKEGGFSSIRVIAPKGYNRPLIIGSK